MTEKEILENYGTVKCEFYNNYKHSFTYVDVDGKFKISGLADYRGDFDKIMSVGDLWNELDTFELTLLNVV
jgi:hypothetical protein